MPVNEAWNCDKGRFGFTHVTASTRITTPRVRIDGNLVEASWPDALARATDALGAADPGHLAVLTGSRLADEDAYLVSKYARSVLGSDDVDHRTRFAPAAERDELAALVGAGSATYDDVEHAGMIVVAGLDPEEEVPILHLRIRKAWRQHTARIVVVGPHLGTLAEIAWRHVATAPGGEASALATLPTRFGDALDAPVIVVGERAGAGTLSAAAGLARASGGQLAYVPRRAGARGAIEAGLAAGLLPGGRRLDDPDDRAAVEAIWGPLPAAPGRDLHGVLEAAAEGRIDVLHLIGVDPLRDAASTALAARALARVGTVIVQDLAETATVAAHADVVLPATARQERAGTATNFEGRAQRFRRAVEAPGLARDDWEIVRLLAGLLGHDLGVDDLDGIRAEVARLGRRPSAHPFPGVPAGAADAPTGAGDGTLAVVARPLLLDRGTMLTGADDLLATARAATAHLSPSDADALGVSDGQTVELAGEAGTLRLPAVIRDDVVGGTVVVPTNATEVSVWALAGDDGALRVRRHCGSQS
jgi:NADH-quinone oxidoreductase subunit G